MEDRWFWNAYVWKSRIVFSHTTNIVSSSSMLSQCPYIFLFSSIHNHQCCIYEWTNRYPCTLSTWLGDCCARLWFYFYIYFFRLTEPNDDSKSHKCACGQTTYHIIPIHSICSCRHYCLLYHLINQYQCVTLYNILCVISYISQFVCSFCVFYREYSDCFDGSDVKCCVFVVPSRIHFLSAIFIYIFAVDTWKI